MGVVVNVEPHIIKRNYFLCLFFLLLQKIYINKFLQREQNCKNSARRKSEQFIIQIEI